MMIESNDQEDITILNAYVPNNRVSKCESKLNRNKRRNTKSILFFIQVHMIFFFTSSLEYNYFTMLCQFLLYNKVNQLYVYIYPHIPFSLEPPSHLPIPHLQVVTKHQVDLPVLCSSFPLAICFAFGSVYMSMLLSHFVPAYPSLPPCPQVRSLCLPLFLPCHQVQQYCFLRFHIYALAYGICFSLSDSLHSVGQTLGPSTSLQITQFHFFLWLSNILLYICATSSLSIHLSVEIQVASMSWLL